MSVCGKSCKNNQTWDAMLTTWLSSGFCSVWRSWVVASFLLVEDWTSIKYRFFRFHSFSVTAFIQTAYISLKPRCTLLSCCYCTAVFFNWGSAEPQGSASGCQGFRRNRPKLPETKFATTIPCGCSKNTASQYPCHYESHGKLCNKMLWLIAPFVLRNPMP